MNHDTITYEAKPLSEVPADLLVDLTPAQEKTHAVIRTSTRLAQVWSFHTSQKQADAAVRRWKARDIVTR